EVFAVTRRSGEKFTQYLGTALILARRHDQPAFADIQRGRDMPYLEHLGRLLSAVESAGDDLLDRNLERPKRLAHRLGLHAAFVRKLPLSLDVVEIQRVGVGLVGIGLRMSNEQNVAPLPQLRQ